MLAARSLELSALFALVAACTSASGSDTLGLVVGNMVGKMLRDFVDQIDLERVMAYSSR